MEVNEKKLIVLNNNEIWDNSAKTVIVAEGLLMYLPEKAVQNLFLQCAEICGTGSRFAFSYVGTRPDGLPDTGPYTRFVLWILKTVGEPWLFSIQPENLGSFLRDNNWEIEPNPIGVTDKHGVEYFGVAVKS